MEIRIIAFFFCFSLSQHYLAFNLPFILLAYFFKYMFFRFEGYLQQLPFSTITLGASFSLVGLIYGIPSDMPLRIKSTPSVNTK